MSKCPKCKKKIEELEFVQEVRETGTFDGEHYEVTDKDWNDDIVFRCPHCHNTLSDEKGGIYGEPQARAFLGVKED